MSKISRRSLAKYAADELASGKSAQAVAQRLAGVLVESGRTGEMDFLLSDISWELEQRGLMTTAKVTSATPLNKQLEDKLKSQIKKATGTNDARLEARVDTSLVGGVRIETASHIWDSTVRRKLTELKENV